MDTPDKKQNLTVYEVYLLGKGYGTGADGKPVYFYPYTLHYAPGHPSGEFFLAEGDARVGNGGFVPAARLLEPMWRAHLEITDTLWLLPLLERLVRGETLPAAEFLDVYRSVHGSPPPREEWPQY